MAEPTREDTLAHYDYVIVDQFCNARLTIERRTHEKYNTLLCSDEKTTVENEHQLFRRNMDCTTMDVGWGGISGIRPPPPTDQGPKCELKSRSMLILSILLLRLLTKL